MISIFILLGLSLGFIAGFLWWIIDLIINGRGDDPLGLEP